MIENAKKTDFVSGHEEPEHERRYRNTRKCVMKAYNRNDWSIRTTTRYTARQNIAVGRRSLQSWQAVAELLLLWYRLRLRSGPRLSVMGNLGPDQQQHRHRRAR